MSNPLESTAAFWGIRPETLPRIVAPPPLPPAARYSPARCVFAEPIRPAWLTEREEVRIPLPDPLPALAAAQGEPLAWFERAGATAPFISLDGGTLRFALSPDGLAAAVLEERYRPSRRVPLALSLPGYHRVPGEVRRLIFRGVNAVKRSVFSPPTFPAWPFDPSVEAVRHAVLRAIRLAAGGEVPTAGLWPAGRRWAAALTHDVDTADGFARAGEFAARERARGLPACYNIVARGYPLDDGRLRALGEAGMEIGLHGDTHDNRIAFLPPREIERRLDSVRPWAERWGVAGFRSPSLLRTEALHRALAPRFLYDSSVPDTETTTSYPNHAGCCSVFPFVRHGILELPLTVPMDSSLIFLGYRPPEIAEAWAAKLETIRELGGLAVVTTHTDRHFSGNPAMLSAYEGLLDRLAADAGVWIARPREIARWWLDRSARAGGAAARGA